MDFKDLFSSSAENYSKFRPTYPLALFDFLAELSPARELAWDCGTGNGQAAQELASRFKQVIATDPSEKQISQAPPFPNIGYRVERGDRSTLASSSCDLVTVAQAFHWFDHAAFSREVSRVARPSAIFSVWCYHLIQVSPEVDAIMPSYYRGTLNSFWEPERVLVEEGYKNIEIPFTEIATPAFNMSARWDFTHFVGYLQTWSALQTAIKKLGRNPLEDFLPQLLKAWGEPNGVKVVHFPLFVRTFRINS